MEKKISWKQLGKSQWLIILLVGILLVVIALPTDKNDNTKIQTKTGGEESGQLAQNQWENYQDQVETRLEEILQQVEGVGKVKVMVSLAGTGETVIEKDVPQSQSQIEEADGSGGSRKTKESSWEESTVYIQQNGEQVPYVIKELAPDIEGICVICQGGDNGTVAKNISEAVQALFPIEVHKIKVMKMK